MDRREKNWFFVGNRTAWTDSQARTLVSKKCLDGNTCTFS